MTNRKTDARVRYTKSVIRDSFLTLLKKKPLDKITVTELCRMAEINRATFYSHYTDCYDLYSSIEDEFLAEFQKTGKTENWSDSRQLISDIYDSIEENMEICEVLIFNVKNPTLLTKMIHKAREYSMDRWLQIMPGLSESEREMLFLHLATGLSAVMYRNFKTMSRDELIDFMVEITNNCMAPYRK